MIQQTINTQARCQWIEITGDIEKCLRENHWQNGILTIFIPHTTAAVTINENADPDVLKDMNGILDKLIPWKDAYRHMEGNSAAHCKSSLLGASESLIIQSGRIQKGTWQGVYFCEFDGPRKRQYWLNFTPSE